VIDDILARAERGDAEAQFHLGASFYYGVMASTDFSEAVRWFRQAAAQNHPRALYELGLMHIRGDGVLKDKEQGHALLLKSAELGYDEAMNALGSAYWRGTFGPSDLKSATEWFRRSAENDDPDGLYYLGLTYEDQGDFKTAAEWYRRAMKWHHAEATCRMAYFLKEGKGEPQNIEQAIELYERAGGEYQYPLAYFFLGEIYDQGRHVPRDYHEAAGYYFLAADEGIASAQLRYAELAEMGHGDPGNPNDAYVWGRVALEHLSDAGDIARGQAMLARIKAKLGPWQLAEVERKALSTIDFLRAYGRC
jgi:TPR repeat protein